MFQVLSFLSCFDLARLSGTSTRMHEICATPSLWAPFVRLFRLPPSYPQRLLVATLHEHIWLRPRLWWSDRSSSGHLVASTFDPTSNTIALRSILTPHIHSNISYWSRDPSVRIFTPTIKVCRWREPVITLGPDVHPDPHTGQIHEYSQGGTLTTRIFRVSPLPPAAPPGSAGVWPPRCVPSDVDRCRCGGLRGEPSQPSSLLEASTDLFQLRREFLFGMAPLRGELETFSAIPEAWYTPTASRPYRGIFVGEVVNCGYQTVMFLQPTDTRIEAVKLTGGPNATGGPDIPRGEFLFVVGDLRDTVRIADEAEWPGAHVIRAAARVTERSMKTVEQC